MNPIINGLALQGGRRIRWSVFVSLLLAVDRPQSSQSILRGDPTFRCFDHRLSRGGRVTRHTSSITDRFVNETNFTEVFA